MNVLLVEPAYYSRYPPLGLLKRSSHHKLLANNVKLVRGLENNSDFYPDQIEITSLFTYSWKPVHDAIRYYNSIYPGVPITVGGIYASLLPKRILTEFPFVKIYRGLDNNADVRMPDYEILKQVKKWEGWDASIIFTSRGCVNKCPFCMVPTMEGRLKNIIDNPLELICPTHNRIIIWDNNFLALKNWKKKLNILKKSDKYIDFNQGLDARLMTKEKAEVLHGLKIKEIRMAYDGPHEKEAAHKAVELLESVGFNRRKISFYTLYNFYDDVSGNYDTPQSFYERVLDILNMGCVSYPMRFVPLMATSKNEYISPMWNKSQLESVAKARRVIGFGGAFPPYSALIQKFQDAEDFNEAFRLNPISNTPSKIK